MSVDLDKFLKVCYTTLTKTGLDYVYGCIYGYNDKLVLSPRQVQYFILGDDLLFK